MNENRWFERAELLLRERTQTLRAANVLVVGMGGVGSYAAEFIARAGVNRMTIVDGDVVDITNINRQLPALQSTVGQSKVQLMAARIRDINPEIELTVIEEFLSPERAYALVTPDFDVVLDCIDSVTPKLNLLLSARRQKVRIVSSMGAGGKMDASQVKVGDISQTHSCYFAKAIRKRLRKMGISKGVRAVYSTEIQDDASLKMTDGSNFKKSFYGTISFMPALFGLRAAEDAIKYLLNKTKEA